MRMSVNGPRSFLKTSLSNIQAARTLMRMGNDSYSATSKTLKGGNSGQFYNCTASNGVSSITDSVELKGGGSVLLYNGRRSLLYPLVVYECEVIIYDG